MNSAAGSRSCGKYFSKADFGPADTSEAFKASMVALRTVGLSVLEGQR